MRDRILLHEWIFGAYLLTMGSALLFGVGPANTDSLVFAALLTLNVTVLAAAWQRNTLWRWRVRLGFYVVAMNVAFQRMRTAVPSLRSYRADEDLRALDSLLFGETPSLLLEYWIEPWLNDLMSACYFLFLPYLAISMIWYLLTKLELAKRFYAGLFSLYGFRFLGYLAVPASGPHLAMAEDFHVPIVGIWFTEINSALMAAGSNGTDVFPSLHCAVSCYLLLFDRRYRPWRYRAYLVPCVGLWLSTVYLRYHYFVDLVAGFALAVFSLWLAFRVHRGENCEVPADVR